jgi:hypothetical protein
MIKTLSLSFGHCLVCLYLLATVLSVFFFWPLSCLSLSTRQWPKDKDRHDNGQKKKTDKTMAKRKRQTIQWPKDKDRQDNGQKIKTSFSFGQCLVCLYLLAIVLSVFIF